MSVRRKSKLRRFRGREFTTSEIKIIQKVVKQCFNLGRWRISLAVCEKLNWFQENGWPKDRACRDVLNHLHKAKVINLPAPRAILRVSLRKDLVKKYYRRKIRFYHPDVIRGDLRAVLAKSDSNERLWNATIQEHHYLGHKVQVGRTLKFLLFRGDQLVGAFSLSDAAYNVRPRDTLLKRLNYTRQDVVNNSRFLLLHGQTVKNDASRALAILAKCASSVWPAYYGTNVKMMETFVDSGRFTGTCYKASNWILIGNTKGYKKSGRSFSNGQTSKFIFVYPLSSKDRRLFERSPSYEP